MLMTYRKLVIQISKNNIAKYQQELDILNNRKINGGNWHLLTKFKHKPNKENTIAQKNINSNNKTTNNNKTNNINNEQNNIINETTNINNNEQNKIVNDYFENLSNTLIDSQKRLNDLSTIAVNGQLITCTDKFKQEFINQSKLSVNITNEFINQSKNNFIKLTNEIKNTAIDFTKTAITEFTKVITKITSYITQISANPPELLIKWLSKPNTIIQLVETGAITGVKNAINIVNIIKPKKFIHNFIQNNVQISIVVISTFYNSIVYSPILNSLKTAINNIINSISNNLLFIKPYINNIKNITNDMFNLINAQKLKEILKQCVNVILNQKINNVFDILKQIFNNYIQSMKTYVFSFIENIKITFNNILEICTNINNVELLNIDETKFNDIMNEMSNTNNIITNEMNEMNNMHNEMNEISNENNTNPLLINN